MLQSGCICASFRPACVRKQPRLGSISRYCFLRAQDQICTAVEAIEVGYERTFLQCDTCPGNRRFVHFPLFLRAPSNISIKNSLIPSTFKGYTSLRLQVSPLDVSLCKSFQKLRLTFSQAAAHTTSFCLACDWKTYTKKAVS